MWQALAPALIKVKSIFWSYGLKSSFFPYKYCMKDKHENDVPLALPVWSEIILQSMNLINEL